MQAIGRRYGEIQLELYNFFEKFKEDMENESWFSVNSLDLPIDGVLRLNEESEEECQRVLQLYTSGVMTGSYSKYKEERVSGAV